jgi:spermidine synthase
MTTSRVAGAGPLAAGLFLVTFATLVLEVLDSRLLSVLTWYHLSFFAVSLAMLGMSAGAVRVFLAGDAMRGHAARAQLGRYAVFFAISVPVSHVVNLCVPIPTATSHAVMEFVSLMVATASLAVPFYLSGIVVTLALTRAGAQIGRIYAWDLLGAAAGCLAVVPLINSTNLSSAAFVAGAAAAAGAAALHRFAGRRVPGAVWMLAAACLALAIVNARVEHGLTVTMAKNRPMVTGGLTPARTAWNSHSFVIIQRPEVGHVFLWGAGAAAPEQRARLAWVVIDGEAGTPITEWDGSRSSLEWVSHDVTTLPYHLRRGKAAVIGVGGGRDVLSALWAGNVEITGIEINSILVDVLTRTHRDFAKIADTPGVRLVHDEARAFLTRTDERYDVLQMSLIDTWAATGAGAFSLTENGLYTREAWQLFLSRLTRGGVFSVSRWFNASNVSETSRLLALGVASLLDRGAESPREQLVMVARKSVATLVLSPSPLTDGDRATIEGLAGREDFQILVSPWHRGASPSLDRIVDSGSEEALNAAVQHADFDFSPPRDRRPFFFNMLRPTRFAKAFDTPRGGVIWGNIRATGTLVLLFVVATIGVALVILWPLLRRGRLPMPGRTFAAALGYFAMIGCGFMLIQVAFLQRFSVLLGHPTYTFAIILFSMILFAGVGSMISDHVSLDSRRYRWIPAAIAAVATVEVLALPAAFEAGAPMALAGRTAIVLAFTAPLSTFLGFCFPIGMRLVGQHSDEATAWMWGVNGACGVLASIVAVAISMWIAIDANLVVAAALYAMLLVPMEVLSIRGIDSGRSI